MADTFETFCNQEIKPLLESLRVKMLARGLPTNHLFLICEEIPGTDNYVSYCDYEITDNGPLERYGQLLNEEAAESMNIIDVETTPVKVQ